MASKGFIELLRLADRARKRADGQLDSSKQLWSGVAFRIGDINCITPLGEVAEVVERLELTQIPKVKPWLKGVANLRGRLLPVTDLTEFSQIVSVGQRVDQRKTIVLDQGGLYSGLVVDQVYGIQHFANTQFEGQSLKVHPGINGYLKGYFKTTNDQVWHVFMLSKLASDERYLDAAM